MTRPWIRWPDGGTRIAYGGDYNPEQWDRATWREDVRLMQQAGVNLVNVAIFGWARLEPRPGEFDFSTYDEVLDLLHAGGIAVDLATATASPPAWLVELHPEMLPRTADGRVLHFGARQSWCPSSAAYREHSLRLTEAVARRYRDHPALALWHVSNELGCHNSRCYCDACAAAFRVWAQRRHGDLDALNAAWGTAFWSQTYTAWSQVQPPRLAPASPNPALALDYQRFSSDALLGQLVAESEVLRAHSPDVAITTNFMVMGDSHALDYSTFTPEVDVVSNDHYLREGDPEPWIELALSADVVRGLAGGAPWMLMESATSAVNWGRINVVKAPGQLRRSSLSQLARGADAIGFFQWRASTSGAEKYHSAMLPHAGPDTRVHREVRELGADLAALGELVGTSVVGDVALVYDWESWWALEGDCHPSSRFDYREAVLDVYRVLWRAGITVDIVPVRDLAATDLGTYPLVLAPALHLVTAATAAGLSAYVEGGGRLLVTAFSAVVDADDRVWPGGAPGPLRDLLGLTVDEVHPLRDEHDLRLADGSPVDLWAEDLAVARAEVQVRYAEAGYAGGSLSGGAALTRRAMGQGSAWYLGCRLAEPDLARTLAPVLEDAGVRRPIDADGLEVVRRRAASGATYVLAINHGSASRSLAVSGVDLLTGTAFDTGDHLGPGDVAVVRLA
ncbi:unannotated protein [freshwater metagenome]|uniref:beta-galactosidase n=1 Tax=freshwater metagenome TaxID=449393 RepID=A0A6J6R0Y5_9ZZZZ